jgi:hypothetical protein
MVGASKQPLAVSKQLQLHRVSTPQNGSASALSPSLLCDVLAALAAKVIVMPLGKSFIF